MHASTATVKGRTRTQPGQIQHKASTASDERQLFVETKEQASDRHKHRPMEYRPSECSNKWVAQIVGKERRHETLAQPIMVQGSCSDYLLVLRSKSTTSFMQANINVLEQQYMMSIYHRVLLTSTSEQHYLATQLAWHETSN